MRFRQTLQATSERSNGRVSIRGLSLLFFLSSTLLITLSSQEAQSANPPKKKPAQKSTQKSQAKPSSTPKTPDPATKTPAEKKEFDSPTEKELAAPHFPKNPSIACPATSQEKEVFGKIENEIRTPRSEDNLHQIESQNNVKTKIKNLKKLNAGAGAAYDEFCSGISPTNRPGLMLCWNACAHGFERGRQDGLSRMQPWTRNLTRSDGQPVPPPAVLAAGPCDENEANALSSKYESKAQHDDTKNILNHAVKGCCVHGFDRGRTRLREYLGASLDSSNKDSGEATKKIPNSLCAADYQEGKKVGSKLCQLFTKSVRNQCKEEWPDGDEQDKSKSGESHKRKDPQEEACGTKPAFTCVPICFALGIEADANGRNDNDQSDRCPAYNEWFQKCDEPVEKGHVKTAAGPKIFRGSGPKKDAPPESTDTQGSAQGGGN